MSSDAIPEADAHEQDVPLLAAGVPTLRPAPLALRAARPTLAAAGCAGPAAGCTRPAAGRGAGAAFAAALAAVASLDGRAELLAAGVPAQQDLLELAGDRLVGQHLTLRVRALRAEAGEVGLQVAGQPLEVADRAGQHPARLDQLADPGGPVGRQHA